MVTRIGRWIVGWAAGFVGTLTVVAAVGSWALAASGIAVDPLIPHVERALRPADGAFEVEIDAARLHWTGWPGAPTVRVRGVRVKGPDGAVATTLPELAVTFSLRALAVHGVLAPVRIDVVGPTVLLARGGDGAIGLRGIAAGRPGDDGRRLAPLARAALARLMNPDDDPGEPLGYLSELRVVGGRVLFEDAPSGLDLAARDAELVMARVPGGLAGRLDLALDQGAAPAAAVRAAYAYRAGGGATELRVEVGGLDPAGFAALAPGLPIDRLDASLDGRLRFTVDERGRMSPIAFDVASAGAAALLPTEALPQGLAFERVRARGRIEGAESRFRLDELRASGGGTNLRARAVVEWTEAPFAAWAEVGVDRLGVDQLGRYWPRGFEAKAREWVLGNVTAGVARDGRVELRLEPADVARRRLSADALDGGFRFAGATVRYLDGMPPATGLAGEARFTADRLDLAIEAAKVGGLWAEGATVALVGLAQERGKRATITVNAAGSVPDALALIDHPPLGFTSRAGIDPARTSGRVRADVRIDFPLAARIAPDMVGVAVEADIGGAAVRGLAGGFDLDDGALRLRADTRALDLEGGATVAGIPMALRWHESFAGDGPRRRYGAAGSVDVAAVLAPRFGAGLGDYVRGRPAFDLRVVQPRGGNPRVELAVDLADAGLRLDALGWRKPEGEPGRLHLSGEIAESGAVAADKVALRAAGLEAEGGLMLEAGSLRPVALDLARLAVGATTTAVRWRPIPDGGDSLELDAEALDLRPLLAAWREGGPDDGEEDGAAAGRLRVALRADRLLLPGGALDRAKGRFVRDPAGIWQYAELRGELDGGGAARAWLAPKAGAGGHRLTVLTGDAGALLRALDLTPAIRGGEMTLTAEFDAQAPDLVGGGVLGVSGFAVADAPALAKVLAVASMTGIANLLQDRGIAFDVLEVPFRFGPGGIEIADARASGSQIGLTLEGTVAPGGGLDLGGTIVPFYGLNRALGRVPLLGTFLAGGGGGDGVFAATYGVSGDRDDPVFRVNPLAVLAPGILRKLVQGIADGSLEPPLVGPPGDGK